MPHNIEQKRLAGQKGKSHGVYALEERGEEALDAEQKGTFLEIEQGLETPEGVLLALRRRVAMSLMVVGVLETYLEQQINGGVSPDGIPIFKSWPAFQNTATRALTQLLATMPKPQHDALAAEIAAINETLQNMPAEPVEEESSE